MKNIVERLRNLPYRPMVDYGNGDVRDELDPDIAEAADEIEKLWAKLRKEENEHHQQTKRHPTRQR